MTGRERLQRREAAAQRDGNVREWLTESPLSQTEKLPAHLQTRWIDASRLPSRYHRVCLCQLTSSRFG